MTLQIDSDAFSPGDTAWFEYHCWESPESNDAPAWYRSHQQVTVLSLIDELAAMGVVRASIDSHDRVIETMT